MPENIIRLAFSIFVIGVCSVLIASQTGLSAFYLFATIGGGFLGVVIVFAVVLLFNTSA